MKKRSEEPLSTEALLEKARKLKNDSRDARDERKYSRATSLITQAIDMLKDKLARLDPPNSTTANTPALSDAMEVAAELADCLGSWGGILRRQNRLPDALKAYEEGKKLEGAERYRIRNSYNLVQSLIQPILKDHSLLHTPETRSKLQETAEIVERQIAISRREDPWAYSDLGLLMLLSGQTRKAMKAWDVMDKLHPYKVVYKSGLALLKDLRKKFPSDPDIPKAADRFSTQAAAGSSRAKAK